MSIVHSVRFPPELSTTRWKPGTDRRAVTPNVLIHDLVSANLVEAL